MPPHCFRLAHAAGLRLPALLPLPVTAPSSQAYVSLNWLLTEDKLDLETELAFGFLNYLMLGTPASPLQKVAPLLCSGP